VQHDVGVFSQTQGLALDQQLERQLGQLNRRFSVAQGLAVQIFDRAGAEQTSDLAARPTEVAGQELIDRNVKLEVCPSSNVALGVVASLAEHPLPRLLERGLAVSLGSDDPPLFGTTLVEEYRRCAHAFGWGPEQVLARACAAVEHSCMPADRQQALRADQRRVVAQFFPEA
jgi:hypothetical protein